MNRKSRPVFLNPSLQRQFQHNGFVLVDLLNTTETAYLRQQLQELDHFHHNGFFTTTWLSDVGIRMRTNQLLTYYLKPYLSQILNKYTFFYGSYFIKNAGEENDCDVHQDWTTTDETRFTSVTVWCALQDMIADNGCLNIMPYSHLLNNYIRARHMPEYLGKVKGFINRYMMRPLPMREGQAIIFNQRLVHGSRHNLTARTRIACGVAGIPQEAPLLHYVAGPHNTLRVLDASNNLYSLYDTFDKLQNETEIATLQATFTPMQWHQLGLLFLKKNLFPHLLWSRFFKT